MSESSHAPVTPQKDVEFEEFLRQIGNANIKNWTILAEAMGVDRKTIYRWRQHPLAQEAINTAISESIKGMEESGKDDWRMYREKAKMLGIKDRQTIEHEVDPESLQEVVDSLKTDYEKLADKATAGINGQTLAPESPLQNQE